MARKIGPLLASALVAGNMVGSGVFLLPATLGAIGSVSLVGWLAATVGAFLTAAVFAQLGRLSGSLDGMPGYAEEGLGRMAGFVLAAVYWMGSWVGTVAIAVAAAGYLAVFFPGLAGPLPLALAAVGAIWLFTAVNLVGARSTAGFGALSLAAGLVPILAVAVLGWLWFDPKVFASSWNVSGKSAFGAVSASLVSAFWAYSGLESAAVVAAVVRDPRRNVAIATYAGTAAAAVVYIAAAAAVMGLAPARELAASTAPFALVGTRMLGRGVGAAVALCALIKTCGTLSGSILLTVESGRAGVDLYLRPNRARPERDASRAPLLIAMAVAMSAAALASVSPTLGRQFGILINVSTLWSVIAYALCAAALMRLAGRGAWGMRASAGAALVFLAWLVTTGDAVSLWLTAGLLAVVGGVWWAMGRRVGRTLPPTPLA